MRRAGMLTLLIIGFATTGFAQSPAPTTHVAVDRAMDKLIETLSTPIPGGAEAAPGWKALLGSIRAELETCAKATGYAERRDSLGRLGGYAQALATVNWPPANDVRVALEAWIAPRGRVVEAVETLRTIMSQGAVSDADAVHRKGWIGFLDERLGDAIKSYENASTVQARLAAIDKIAKALDALEKATAWEPSLALAGALRSLHALPNFDVTADANSLAGQFARHVVNSGPVQRKGYVSQVTAGPYLGFGLFASDEGIGFYNQQAYTNYTPIWDFQQQMQEDPRGRKVSKLYNFNVASADAPTLTVMTLLSPAGIRLWPQFNHNIDMLVASSKTPGHGLQRGILSLIGMNQRKITEKVYENGVGKIRANVTSEALAESTERMNAAAAEENAKLADVLVGNRTAVVKNIAITELAMRSRPEYAWVSGNIGWLNLASVGADFPQPPQFVAIESGVAADVHLGSALSNLAKGAWTLSQVKDVDNILVETRPIKAGESPLGGLKVGRNVKFEDFSKAVSAAREVNDPKAIALWLQKPESAPSFAVDARGNLVVLVSDFQLDVQVPPQLANMTNNARILRLQSPLAEFVLGIETKPGDGPNSPPKITATVKEFSPGASAKLFTIDADESKAQPLEGLRRPLILAGFSAALASRPPIEVPTDQFKIPGFDLRSVSAIDPTGWVRVVLAPSVEPAPATVADVSAGD